MIVEAFKCFTIHDVISESAVRTICKRLLCCISVIVILKIGICSKRITLPVNKALIVVVICRTGVCIRIRSACNCLRCNIIIFRTILNRSYFLYFTSKIIIHSSIYRYNTSIGNGCSYNLSCKIVNIFCNSSIRIDLFCKSVNIVIEILRIVSCSVNVSCFAGNLTDFIILICRIIICIIELIVNLLNRSLFNCIRIIDIFHDRIVILICCFAICGNAIQWLYLLLEIITIINIPCGVIVSVRMACHIV